MVRIRNRQDIEKELASLQLPNGAADKINKLLEEALIRDDMDITIPLGKDGVADPKYGRAIVTRLKSAGYDASLTESGVYIFLHAISVGPTTVSCYDSASKKQEHQLSSNRCKSIGEKLWDWIDRKGYWLPLLVLIPIPAFLPDFRVRLATVAVLVSCAILFLIGEG